MAAASSAMADDLKSRADARLAAALAADAAPADPRPLFRPVLRHLREHDPAAFTRAIAHFEDVLVPAVAEGGDPLAAWMEYGLLLAAALGGGRMLEVDPTGFARPVPDPNSSGQLVLHVPDSETAPVLVLRHPASPSAAQVATVELLVDGRVSASAYR
jgi:hypothetical protein